MLALQGNLRGKLSVAVVACAAAMSVSEFASAGLVTVQLGNSGWQAEWDNALNPLVDINFVDQVGDAVFIQKSIEFTSFTAVPIVFRQISQNAVSNIVIDDEILTNSTGLPWTDFHMSLSSNLNNTAFDPANSAGFSVAPFTNSVFSAGNTQLDIFGGGSVPDGGIWFPGLTSGQLWIHVDLAPTAPTVFTLTEVPTPAPGVLGLLATSLVVGTGRRRRSP